MITSGWAAVIIAILGFAATAVAAWLKLNIKAQGDRLDAIDKGQGARLEGLEKSLSKLDTDMNSRLGSIHETSRLEGKEKEERLARLERDFVSRDQLERSQEALMAAIKEVGKSVDNLHADIVQLVQRVAVLESKRP